MEQEPEQAPASVDKGLAPVSPKAPTLPTPTFSLLPRVARGRARWRWLRVQVRAARHLARKHEDDDDDDVDGHPRVHLDAPSLEEVVTPLWAALKRQVAPVLGPRPPGAGHAASHLRLKPGAGRYLLAGQAGETASRADVSLPDASPVTSANATNYSQLNLLQETPDTTLPLADGPVSERPAASGRPAPVHYPSTLYPVSELEGMRLGRLPAAYNLSHYLLQACREIGQPLPPDGDALAHQTCLARAWKVLLLGLGQPGALARRVALVALGHATTYMQDTLVEGAVIGRLVLSVINVIGSDERLGNRLRAIDVAGQLGQALGPVREHSKALHVAFRFLAKRLLSIQLMEREGKTIGAICFTHEHEARQLKIHLVRALGKYVQPQASFYEEARALVVHAIQAEFQTPNVVLPNTSPKAHEISPINLVHSLLYVLAYDIPPARPENELVMSTLFRNLVHPFLACQFRLLQALSAKFLSTWPAPRDGYCGHAAVCLLQAGLQVARSLLPDPAAGWQQQEAALAARLLQEEGRITLRTSLLRKLIQPPGTYGELRSVPEEPGVFVNMDARLLHSNATAIHLPVHPGSRVTLYRVIPRIPGVPDGCTTTPLIFSSQPEAEPPASLWEFAEGHGLPELPQGLTYLPATRAHNAALLSRINAKHPAPAAGVLGKGAAAPVPPEPSWDSASASMMSALRRLRAATHSLLGMTDLLAHQDTSLIPPEAVLAPSRGAEEEHGAFRAPYGFEGTCPYPGFDRNKVTQQVSAIHGAQRPISMLGKTDSALASLKPPTGMTFGRHPILFPKKGVDLEYATAPKSDFPLGCPVLVEVIHPETAAMQLALAVVCGVNRDVSMKVVQRLVRPIPEGQDQVMLALGATFHLFHRSTATGEWGCAELEIVHEHYRDALDPRNGLRAKRADPLIQSPPTPTPIPAGYTASAEPYFAPPIHLPPIPVAYMEAGVPVYEHTPRPKPPPSGITTTGVRFYLPPEAASPPLAGQAHQLAGFDNRGDPLYLPKGCVVPAPTGFTTDGIPYYDVLSMLHRKERALSALPTPIPTSAELLGTLDDLSLEQHAAQVQETQLAVASIVARFQADMKRHFARRAMGAPGAAGASSPVLPEPTDALAFLAGMGDLQAYNTAAPVMRFTADHAEVEFVSSCTPSTKVLFFRYRPTARGDRAERDFYVSAEPQHAFSVRRCRMPLQGEGVMEVAVTFSPLAMGHREGQRGSLYILDESGARLCRVTLLGVRSLPIALSTSAIDLGWLLPGQGRDTAFTLTSLSQAAETVVLESRYERSRFGVTSSFKPSVRMQRLQATEVKIISLSFTSTKLGRHVDVLEVSGPGGARFTVPLTCQVGFPLLPFPENGLATEFAGSVDAAALTRHRTAQLQRHLQWPGRPGAVEGSAFLRHVFPLAHPDAAALREAHTLEFGICQHRPENRFVTIVNRSGRPTWFGLHSSNRALTYPRTAHVAAHATLTIALTVDLSKFPPGDMLETVTLLSPECSLPIPIYLVGFVGQPLFLPAYPLAFFKPCPPGEREVVSIPILNASRYPLTFVVAEQVGVPGAKGAADRALARPCGADGEEPGEGAESVITTSLPTDEARPCTIYSHSLLPVTFTFRPQQRGLYQASYALELLRPFRLTFPAALFEAPLQLHGLCLDAHADLQDGPLVESMRAALQSAEAWASAAPELDRRLRAKAWEERATDPAILPPPFMLSGGPMYYRTFPDATPASPEGEVAFKYKRTGAQSVTLTHQGAEERDVLALTSCNFTPSEARRPLRVDEVQQRVIMFYARGDERRWDYYAAYGFGLFHSAAHASYATCQLVGKPPSTCYCYPCAPARRP